MKRIQRLLICVIATPALVYAQELPKKGFIVGNNADTVHGWIGLRPWNTNPDHINFRKDSLAGRRPDTFRLQDLAFFEVTGYDAYARAVLPPNTITSPSGPNDSAPKSDSVFLRLLVRGNRLSLWEYSNGGDLFFISEAKDSFQLLTNEQPDDNNPMSKFKLQLAAYIQKYGLAEKLEQPLLQAGYEEHNLSTIVKAINEPAGEVYTAPAIKKSVFSWFAGAGGGAGKLVTPADVNTLGTLLFKYGFMPVITTGVDYSNTRDLNKLIVRMQLAFGEAIYDGYATAPTTSLDQEHYHIQQWTISPAVSVLYHFTSRETNRIYAGAGLSYNYSFYPQNYLSETLPTQTIKDYIPLSKGWLSGNLLLGIRLDHRWEIACSGLLFGSLSQAPYTLTPRTFLAGVYYHIK